ncbi:hypothetical protein AAF712_011771 [Marasmius tenuissimus]|uniref:Uncharacterized protein n=1 Tax=Marasmius tenuissimus TaxID=585030 RepID=A0ABR2ZJ15_9AGAR
MNRCEESNIDNESYIIQQQEGLGGPSSSDSSILEACDDRLLNFKGAPTTDSARIVDLRQSACAGERRIEDQISARKEIQTKFTGASNEQHAKRLSDSARPIHDIIFRPTNVSDRRSELTEGRYSIHNLDRDTDSIDFEPNTSSTSNLAQVSQNMRQKRDGNRSSSRSDSSEDSCSFSDDPASYTLSPEYESGSDDASVLTSESNDDSGTASEEGISSILAALSRRRDISTTGASGFKSWNIESHRNVPGRVPTDMTCSLHISPTVTGNQFGLLPQHRDAEAETQGENVIASQNSIVVSDFRSAGTGASNPAIPKVNPGELQSPPPVTEPTTIVLEGTETPQHVGDTPRKPKSR